MTTIRRLYLYAVGFISLEIVLWSLIVLASSALAGVQDREARTRLAGALSLVLVGLPVFILHWWLAQRGAVRDPDERFAGIRAVFLYGTWLAVLLPCAQNIMAWISRALLAASGLPATRAWIGGQQTAADNLAALLGNALVAVAVFAILRGDWRASPIGDAYPTSRRAYRHIWMVYALGLVVLGLGQVIRYLFEVLGASGLEARALLANGSAMIVVGVPIWAFTWRLIQGSLADPDERRSRLRLAVLYLLTLAAVLGALGLLGQAIYTVLRGLMGERPTIARLLSEISRPVSLAIPLGAAWVIYGRTLAREMSPGSGHPWGEGLQRLYHHSLALAGLAAFFVGLQVGLAFVISLTLGASPWGMDLRDELAAALAILAVSTPLWWVNWAPLARGAAGGSEAGEHLRRSLTRRGYLYVALFVAVVGAMFSAGALIFLFLNALLGSSAPDLALESAQLFKVLLLFALLGGYHWRALRSDSRLAERSQAEQHARFSVLVLEPGEGDFAREIVDVLQRQIPACPVAIIRTEEGVPGEALAAAEAVVLPADLAANPPEALRLWLGAFTGVRLVVPRRVEGWVWLGEQEPSSAGWGQQVALAVRQLAEGQEVRPASRASPWLILAYALGGLTALVVLSALISVILALVN